MSIRVVQDLAAVAETAAALFVEAAVAAVARAGRFTVALSGGSTPRPFHARLADPSGAFRSRVPWTACHFFWGDERHVPPDHPDSNFRMAKETLLEPLQIPAAQIHRIHAELDATAAAAQYESDLRRFFGDVPFPPIDLQVLGMGPDGHTASLFPGGDAVRETTRWVVAPWVEKLHTSRITMSPPAINAASEAIVIIAGADKADALHHVLEGSRDPDRWPAQVIAPGSGRLDWIVDRAAASQLSPHLSTL